MVNFYEAVLNEFLYWIDELIVANRQNQSISRRGAKLQGGA